MARSIEGYIVPRSLHSVAGAPNHGAQEKAGHSGRDDRQEEAGRDCGCSHLGSDAAELLPRSLDCAARRAKVRRGRKSRAASLGMTEKEKLAKDAGFGSLRLRSG